MGNMGPDLGQMVALFIIIAFIGGVLFIGGEHLILWAIDHVHVSWGVK
jgi:hypothetical protein